MPLLRLLKKLEETLKELKKGEHTYGQMHLLLSPKSNENNKFIGNTVLSAIRDLEELYEGLLKYLEFTKEWSNYQGLKHT